MRLFISERIKLFLIIKNFILFIHHQRQEMPSLHIYTHLKKINYTTLYYEIFFDKKYQVILFKNLSIYTRSAPAGNSYKFWIDSTPECGNDAFKYFSEHYLISQPAINR